jgi:putative peptide zinc metalloprotease protein
MALSLMVVCSVSTVFFNGNPLMRFDGYYVLADWIEIPNLRDRSNRYLQRIVMDKCLGIEVQPEPYMELWRRILFVTYAIVSWFYRWMITFVILTFMATFLKPYKLQIISTMLAAMALGSMIGWPLYRLGKALHKRGRLPDMKPVRVTITAIVVAALLFVFFFVPLPVSRVRETGLVQIQPRDVVHVHLEIPGKLEKIFVQEGQWVAKGTVLAEFSNLELKNQEDDLRARYEIKRQDYHLIENQLVSFRGPNPKEREKLRSDLNEAQQERDRAEAQLKLIKRMLEEKPLLSGTPDRMLLRAPTDGHAINVPLIDEVGKRWEKESGQPFCSIGDPSKLRVLVPVSPDNYDLVRDNDRKVKERGGELPVTLRVHGRDSKTWQGRISYLPGDAAKEVPLALSNKVGGPIAIKPSNNPNQLVPQSQIYLLGIDIEDADGAIVPGVLAQVKIHCEYRSAAWWVWRMLSSTFDLGLL